MTYVVPNEITLTSTNVAEDSLSEWSVGATYNTYDEIKVSADKKKYKYAGIDGTNTATEPSLHSDTWSPSPLNPYAMISDTTSSITSNNDTIDVVFSAQNIDTISLLNVVASSVEIDIKHNLETTELIALGDGVETDFTYTSNALPFDKCVEIWVDGVKEAEDTIGDGTFENVSGSYVVSGSVDYSTGDISVSFGTAPLNGLSIQLRYYAKIYSINEDMTYDDLASFGDYLFTEQELKDSLTGILSTTNLDNVIASMSETQLLNQFTANPPVYYNVDIHISIKNIGSVAECGYLIIGRKRSVGASLYGGSVGLKTTASRDRDSWGEVVFTSGTTYNTMDVPVVIDDTMVDIVEKRLKTIMNIPCLFIGDDTDNPKYQSMTLYGFYFDLEAPITPTKTQYNLRVESLL